MLTELSDSLETDLVVCEGVEAMFAVVGAHPTGTHTSEGELLHTEMHDGVVDTNPAARGPPGEQLLHLLAGGEQVEGQGLVPPVDDLDRLLRRVDRDDGQYRAEYLVLPVL